MNARVMIIINVQKDLGIFIFNSKLGTLRGLVYKPGVYPPEMPEAMIIYKKFYIFKNFD